MLLIANKKKYLNIYYILYWQQLRDFHTFRPKNKLNVIRRSSPLWMLQRDGVGAVSPFLSFTSRFSRSFIHNLFIVVYYSQKPIPAYLTRFLTKHLVALWSKACSSLYIYIYLIFTSIFLPILQTNDLDSCDSAWVQVYDSDHLNFVKKWIPFLLCSVPQWAVFTPLDRTLWIIIIVYN